MAEQVVEIPIEQYKRRRGGGGRRGSGKGEWIVIYLMCESAVADNSACPAIPHTANSTRLSSGTFPTRALAIAFAKAQHGGFASPFYSCTTLKEMGQSPPKGGNPTVDSSQAGYNVRSSKNCEPRVAIVPRSLYLRRDGECGLVATFGGSRMCHFKWRKEDRDRGVVAVGSAVKGAITS